MIDLKNLCRCPKKALAVVQQGIVDKDWQLGNRHYIQTMQELPQSRKDEISDDIQLRMVGLFRNSPFQVRQELDQLFDTLLP